MARRKMLGGGDEGGLIVIWGIALVVLVVVAVVALTKTKSKFVSGPSATGDQKEVTPAGNVILY